MVDTIISVNPRITSEEGGKTPEETIKDLAKNIEERLPKELNTRPEHVNKIT